MNIVIIGCGYIGSAIASLWNHRGEHVTVTTRSPEKLGKLAKIAQKSVILKGNNEEEFIQLIANNDVIVVTIAADSSDRYESAYLDTAQTFRHLALGMNLPRRLIYTSSTSVYGDHHGLWVDESSKLKAISTNAAILIESEKTYLSLEELGWSVCILRLAEIYGPGRELLKRIKQFEGQVLPGSGNQFTNMIHKDDCVAGIDFVLQRELEGIFNLADDEHPSRKQLYDVISEKFHLPKVTWNAHLVSLQIGNKRISNHKIKAAGFSFLHPQRILA